MTTVYDLLRQRCGLSQVEAANMHGVSLNSLQSWCTGRRTAPPGVVAELRALYLDIRRAADELGARVAEQPKTFADDMASEAARLRQRFIHHTRPREPLSLEQAMELSAQMEAAKPVEKTVTLGTVESDAAARRLGFPAAGAHAAALGLAIAALPDDVRIELVPYRAGVETAIAVLEPVT